MRSCLPRLFAAAAVSGGLLLTGCSNGGDGTSETASSQPSSQLSAPPTSSDTPTAAPGEVGVSPGGVTTAVGAPAASTEEEYFQACNTARLWMVERGGEIKAQLEPYLAEIQRSDASGPGTFGEPWSKLAPGRQAAVIVAAQAAADELCG